MAAEKADILAQRDTRLGLVHQLIFGAVLLVFPALTVLTAFGIAPGTAVEDLRQVPVVETLDLAIPEPAPTAPSRYVTQERVLRGDTVAALFERLGIRDARALDFLRADATGRTIFRQLVPGRMLQAETGDQGELLALRYFLGSASLLEVTRGADGFTARNRAVAEAPRVYYKTATIRSSLFAATDGAAKSEERIVAVL